MSLGQIEIEKLRKSIIYSGEKTTVWDDWQLLTVESELIRNFIQSSFPHLKIFRDLIFISEGTDCNFHLDRFHVYHLLHRILIPLDNNYRYEWLINETVNTLEPKLGEVLLFNNMVPHRFVSDNKTKREAVYLDLYDPLVAHHLADFKGNYSHENSLLEKKYR